MPASKTQQAVTADRRAKNLQMRLGGATWDQIAARLGYASKAAACKDFGRALEATRATTEHRAAELREIELLRYDRLQAGLWPAAAAGDYRASDVVLKISDRRVKLLKLLDPATGSADNAVDAWLDHLTGGSLDPDDAAALAAVA